MNLRKIEKQYNFLFDDTFVNTYIPLQFESQSYTLIPNTDDAVTLNPPKVGLVKENTKFSDINHYGNTILIREHLSLSSMSKIDKDFTYGCFFLSGVINSILFKAQTFKNNKDQKIKVSFKNHSGDIFRELDTSNGFEIRLYISFE